MALTPKDSDVFLREVDEELRRDQLRGLYARYGKLIIAAVVLFLAAVAAFLWWQNHQRTLNETHAEEFTGVLHDVATGKVKGADPRIDKLAEEGNATYRTQVMLLKAGLAAQAGKDAEAIPIYRQVANDGDVPQPFRDAALVRLTALEYDKLQPAAVIDRLKPLAVRGNPWFGSAGEMVGVAYMRLGKAQLASPIFEALAKDEKVPGSIRQRANEVALSLGIDAGLQANSANPAPAEEASQ